MSTISSHSPKRVWHGTRQIIEFNWPQYVVGVLGTLLAAAIAMCAPIPDWLQSVAVFGAFVAAWWLVASIYVSWWIYDHSDLTQWRWLALFASEQGNWANIHAGFDETTEYLEELFPATHGIAIDIYDPKEITEGSIRRARRIYQQSIPSLKGAIQSLPLADTSRDMIFLLFAAHEVRCRDARVGLLREALRTVKPGGRLIIVEHLRNLSNFLAFGIGSFHFFSERTWMADAASAGWTNAHRFLLNPFVAVFVWTKSP